ncbi:MAG TPA: type IX secretion system outer membrane channel protein PorV [Chitinophagaceae bacterium]|jgi:hypothetical protein|nr:type IX secretion system outer membrane channel protein PorV [Chitinophagaceae bacterium]
MHKALLYLFCTIMVVGCCELAYGQGISTDNLDGRQNAINTAVPFLRISPDARSGSMGDAGIALSPDANAVYWNLAKLPFAKNDAGASVTYTPWLTDLVNDVFLAYLSGYKQLDDMQAVGASLRYFDLGNVQFTNILGQPQGNFHPREFSFDMGYARKLSDNWSMGVALRYIYSNLAGGSSQGTTTFKAGQAVAGDISGFYTSETDYTGGQSGTWNFGLTITNIGTKISYSDNGQFKNFIPTNLGIGGAYTEQFDEYNKITFEIDINKLLVPTPDTGMLDADGNPAYLDQSVVSGIFHSFTDAPGGFHEEINELMYSAGVEYWYNNLFAVRAGYFNENKHKGDRKYFTLGLGLKYNSLGINFSYLVPSGSGVQRNPLSNTLRFSLLFDLGKSNNQN